jgi:hypothetical protein
MVTLRKLYTSGPAPKLVRGMDAIESIHTIENHQFYNSLEKYVGWTIIDINPDIDFFDVQIQDIYIASCNWLEGFCTTCFDLVEDVFDFTKSILSDLIGKTIVAIGTIDDSEIQYYQSIVKRYNIAATEKLKKQETPQDQEVLVEQQAVTC